MLSKIKSTKASLEDFKQSFIWKDICEELDRWIKDFDRELIALAENSISENQTTANILIHLGDINGRRKAVFYMKQLPDLFIQLLESKTKENKNENYEMED